MDVATEVIVDETLCLGGGVCSYSAPGAFAHDEDGKAYVTDPEGSPREDVLKAREHCPAQAIIVRVDGVDVL